MIIVNTGVSAAAIASDTECFRLLPGFDGFGGFFVFNVFIGLNLEFCFDFDPCPLNADFNGLNIAWGKCNFVNPPYSDIKNWVKKML